MGRLLAGIAPMAMGWRSGCLPRLAWRRRSSPSGGPKAPTRPRTTRCLRWSRSSKPGPGVKVELTWHAAPEMIAKLTAAAGRRRAARHRLCRCLQPAGGGPLGVRRQARGHLRRHGADQGSLRAQHRGGGLARQRQDRQAGLLRLSPQAADPAHPVLEGHPGRGRLQGERHPLYVAGVLGLLVRQGAAGLARGGRRCACSASAARWASSRRTPTSRSCPGSTPTTSGWSTRRARSWSATPRCGKGSSTRSRTIPISTPRAARRLSRQAGRMATTTSPSTAGPSS